MRRPTLIALLALVLTSSAVRAQEAVFVVRHAERADGSTDPSLSPEGRARAERLAAVLKDSGITRIITTDLRRTIETAAPLASALHLDALSLKAADTDALLSAIHHARPHDRLLVVGHSNTVPLVLAALGVPGVSVGDQEFDNLFVVVPRPGSAPVFVRQRY